MSQEYRVGGRIGRYRTWPVFLVGIGSLLALLFLPGLVALRRTASVYLDIRRIQTAHRETQRSLAEIERRAYLISIDVREALLDPSPVAGTRYRATFDQLRSGIDEQLSVLRRQSASEGRVAVARLEQELQGYFDAVQPVFDWRPSERPQRGAYFLREQQRPRRQSIIEIAEEIGRLTESSYVRQMDEIDHSQARFAGDIQRVLALALLIGIGISGVTIFRIMRLEDRAERHRVKTELAEAELRHLSSKLMQAQEEERTRISRELHDEVGQMLTALRMGLGSLDRVRNDDSQYQERVGEVKSLAEQALRSVRDIAVGLRPSVLDLGLVPALQWQARRFSQFAGIPAVVHYEGAIGEIPEDYRTCVYRVVQECLTNAVKHAEAKRVDIDISEAGGLLHVRVRDDGKGFRASDGHGSGLGLVGMEERIRELGGTLTVASQPAAGTAITVEMRLPAEERA